MAFVPSPINENSKSSLKHTIRISSFFRKSRQDWTSSPMSSEHHFHILLTTILLKNQDTLERESGCIVESTRSMILSSYRASRMIRLLMSDVLPISFSRKRTLQKILQRERIFSIFLGYISRMEENQNRHGKTSLYFILSLGNIWMLFAIKDIWFSGEVISIVHMIRLISHDLEKMMGRLDFTHLSVLGSMDESKMDGLISGDKRIHEWRMSIHGGMLSHALVRVMYDGVLMRGGGVLILRRRVLLRISQNRWDLTIVRLCLSGKINRKGLPQLTVTSYLIYWLYGDKKPVSKKSSVMRDFFI